MRFRNRAIALAACTSGALLSFAPWAGASNPSVTLGSNTFTIGTPVLDQVAAGSVAAPWNTSQADSGQTQQPLADLWPSYVPSLSAGTQLSNLAAYPGASAGGGVGISGQTGTPGPVDGYCSNGGSGVIPETGTVLKQPALTLPMSPYYFPYIVSNGDGSLTGYFDYRPKDTDEALVSAQSSNGGVTWSVNGEALEQNQGLCPDGDTNDNGQGHSFVTTVGSNTELYTLNRVAGDTNGVGLLVHNLTAAGASESSPLGSLPSAQSVGMDPSAWTTSAVSLSSTAQTIPVNSLGVSGSPVAINGAGHFLDYTAGNNDVITCTGSDSSPALDGCTAATPETVNSGDTLVQLLSTVTTAPGTQVPTGPDNAAQSGGVTIVFSAPANTALATLEEANLGAGRIYVDGKPVYCVNESNTATLITVSNCVTTSASFTVSNGDPVTFDPTVPSGAQMTTGLYAPDGIVGTIPDPSSVPSNATTIIYGEKILNYFDPMTTAATAAAGATTVSVSSTSFLSSGLYPQLDGGPTTSNPISLTVGLSAGGYETFSCTGFTATSFTGCSGITTAIASGIDVAIPGAALVPGSVLSLTGEGKITSTGYKTLYKNNEDYTILREAYTTDGVDFTDITPEVSTQAAPTTGLGGTTINNPANALSPAAGTGSPTSTPTAPYDNPLGSAEPTTLRWVGTRGSIINEGATLIMLDSGAWASDGDSDAFNQIFATVSTDGGVTWSTPVTIVSTDYTFSARVAQDAALASGTDSPLNVSGYYSGRAYSPTAVLNSDGSVTLTFSGYSAPKPLPAVGSVVGTNTAAQWTVTKSDPALYRDILTVTLTPQVAAQTPESPLVVALPLLAFGTIGAWMLFLRRRYRQRRLTA